jgi:N-acetylglucosamine kinase-like BadF-type ATPase
MATTKKPPRTKLTKEVQEIILRHLRAGAFFKHAVEASGVEWRTAYYWLDRGQAGQKPYAEFARAVMKLRAEDAIRSQSIITRAQMGRIDGDWKAAAWALERKYPKEYGQAAMAAGVTVRTGGGPPTTSDDDGSGNSTTVQFYLPDNGRRPQDDKDE